MITKNLEKEFKIEIIASLLENRLLNYEKSKYIVTEDDLYELCSFVSGENINYHNFYITGNIARKIILELNPELDIRINFTNDHKLDSIDTSTIINVYKLKFGNSYKIKSIKKCLIKSLKNTK